MFYTIYRTTNRINHKIYIGMHKTENPYDDYFGSGLNLNRAMRRYGKDNFYKEILFVFDNKEEMILKEKELVTEEFCQRKDTYNICQGGTGGPLRKGTHWSDSDKLKISNSVKRTTQTLEFRENARNRRLGHKFNDTARKNMSDGHKHLRWISNHITKESKFVPMLDIDEYTKSGWIFGRKYNNSLINSGTNFRHLR